MSMYHDKSREKANAGVLAWTEACAEEDGGADADEPPEQQLRKDEFKRTPLPSRRGSEHESLLTKALHKSEDEAVGEYSQDRARRRRSINSNFSNASTLELSCETGLTTPARTSSPSPRLPDVGFVPITSTARRIGRTSAVFSKQTHTDRPAVSASQRPKDPTVELLEKKRCIKFACAARPKPEETPKTASPSPAKQASISFACSRPYNAVNAPQTRHVPQEVHLLPAKPVTVEKRRSLSTIRSGRSATPRRHAQDSVGTHKPRLVSADSKELRDECLRFHEFATDEPQDDDWIRQAVPSPRARLTINDTLEKENAIRKLGTEVEEELEAEENENDEDGGDEDEEGIEEEEDDLDNTLATTYAAEDDDFSGYGSDDDRSDFDEDDEDDDLELWSVSAVTGVAPVLRSASFESDSGSSQPDRPLHVPRGRRARAALSHEISEFELLDSTDFVCGTLDEDRPLEEAYISHLSALKNRKEKYTIPQDIDPSFPMSDEEEDAAHSSDQQGLFGELDDLHHDVGRKKKHDDLLKKRNPSPRLRRLQSPPPRARGRSPRRPVDRPSPRRQSPPLNEVGHSPAASPVFSEQAVAFKALIFRPGLTQAKSLPRAPSMFPHLRKGKIRASTLIKENHIRGAIDIVKGLEQKRARRKEKFLQKYCNRARKEKAHERRPPPGQGAAHMREIGLLMAGKIGQGNYVLSV